MRTLVYPPPSGIGHTAYVGVIAHEITGGEAFAVAARLAGEGLHVLPGLDEHHVLHLWPVLRPFTTGEEVRVLRAFLAVTDGAVHWHPPSRPVRPSCLLCGASGVVLEHDLCGRCARPFQPAPAWGVA